MTPLLFGGTTVIGLALIALGLRTMRATQQRFAEQLQARQDEISAQEGDPRLPPSTGEPAMGGDLILELSGMQRPWPYLRTCYAPALSILRARAGSNLEPVKPYLAASTYQALGNQGCTVAAGTYKFLFAEAASAPVCQGMRVDVTGKGFGERWTLVRGHNLIQCRSCGASVSGELEDKCQSCRTPCNGFEPGWRVLDIIRSAPA